MPFSEIARVPVGPPVAFSPVAVDAEATVAVLAKLKNNINSV